jgi:hypothetical protein
MAQTAITKAIEQIKDNIENSNYAIYRVACQDAIQILTDLLPYERETIEAAYREGSYDNNADHTATCEDKDRQFDNSQDYFTKKYNQ